MVLLNKLDTKEIKIKLLFTVYVIFQFIKVQSGDCVIIRSLTSRDGKPLEKQLMLSNINAPRLGRRANPNNQDSVGENEQVGEFKISV